MCADRYYGWYGHGDRPKQDLLTVTILGGFIALRIRLEAVNTMSQEVVPDTRLDSPCPVDIEWTHGFGPAKLPHNGPHGRVHERGRVTGVRRAYVGLSE